MGSRAEGGLGHADHRDAELSVRMRAQARPAAGVEVSVAIDHQEAQSAQTVQDRTDRREFTQVELTRPVWPHLRHDFSPFSHYLAEAGIGGYDGCGPRTPGTRVVHIHSHERAATCSHVLSLPDLTTFPAAPASAGLVYADGFGALTKDAFLHDFAGGVEPGLARVLWAVQGRVSDTLFKDRTISPGLQRFMAGRMEATTVEIEVGHLSLITHPEEVTQLIMSAVQAVRLSAAGSP
jgi:hypothetical protein